MLQELGFEIVGQGGAGGFAEVDDESVVFSAFVSAPVKQVIADLARPVAIICAKPGSATVFTRRLYVVRRLLQLFYMANMFLFVLFSKPTSDPESPRTRQMWKGYKSWDFPVQSESVLMEASLKGLMVHARVGEGIVAD